MIFSYELEQHVLAGLIKMPQAYSEISSIISEEDFYTESSSVNQTIFKVLRLSLDKGEYIDEIVLSQRILDLHISFLTWFLTPFSAFPALLSPATAFSLLDVLPLALLLVEVELVVELLEFPSELLLGLFYHALLALAG